VTVHTVLYPYSTVTTVTTVSSLSFRTDTNIMVIVVAAAVTAAGYGVYKGGQSAVHGVQNKMDKVKDRRERNKERQGLDFVRQKKQEEADRKERIARLRNETEGDSWHATEQGRAALGGSTTTSTSTGTGDASIKDRVARFKSGIGSTTEKKPAGRFSRFGKKGNN
jgi:sensor domain CHASE-containing protein